MQNVLSMKPELPEWRFSPFWQRSLLRNTRHVIQKWYIEMSENPVSDLSEIVWSTTAKEVGALRDQLWPLLRPDTPPKPLEHWVLLTDCGPDKARVVWTLRDKLGLSLADAHKLASKGPVRIPVPAESNFDTEACLREIQNMGFELQQLGATVEKANEEEWHVFQYATEFLKLFPRLQLRPDWELVAQIYSGPQWGSRRIWTMPPGAPPCREQDQLLEGEPAVGAREFAEALIGDGSPQSYIEASVLMRELRDSGADPHLNREGLSQETIISKPIAERAWKWELDDVTVSSDLEPCVVISKDGHATVTFFSECHYVNVRVMRHRDRYPLGSYVPTTETVRCADGGHGYVH